MTVPQVTSDLDLMSNPEGDKKLLNLAKEFGQIRNQESSKRLVLEKVSKERNAQDKKWGPQHRPDGTGSPDYQELATIARDTCDEVAAEDDLTWADVLLEEVFEALAESDIENLSTELVQVAAVCVAWLEDIESR